MLVASTFLYLTLIGVPQFVKDQLQHELQARGVQLDLGRVRLRGARTLQIDDVSLGQRTAANSPRLLIKRAELQLDTGALLRFSLSPELLKIRQGEITWPTSPPLLTAQSTNWLAIDQITTELRFLARDHWHLEKFQGRLQNLQVEISGRITNAAALRQAKPARPESGPTDWVQRLQPIMDQLHRLQFQAPAHLSLHLEGDGRRPNSFRVHFSSEISSADTPWVKLEKLKVAAIISPAHTNHLNAQIRLSCLRATSKHSSVKRAQLQGRLTWSTLSNELQSAQANLSAAQLGSADATVESHAVELNLVTENQPGQTNTPLRSQFTAKTSQTRLGRAQTGPLHLEAAVSHSARSVRPLDGTFTTSVLSLATPHGSCREAKIAGRVHSRPTPAQDPASSSSSSSTASPLGANPAMDSWGPWRLLAPFALESEWRLSGFDSPTISVDQVAMNSEWTPPKLNISQFNARLYEGQFNADAQLDVSTRELRSRAQFNFDAHRIAPLLTTNAQRWLRQFTWVTPPEVRAQARLRLPAWTNQTPNWRAEVLPTIELAGEFSGKHGAFRDVPVTAARSTFSMTNQFWRLPDLTVIRPEGAATLDYRWWMPTRDYYWKIKSSIDLTALRPVLDPPEQKVLDEIQFSVPPQLEAEIWGRWHDRHRVGFQGHIAATNFVFRNESCSSLAASLHFTNLFLRLQNIHIRSGSQQIRAAAAGFDPVAKFFYVTNGVSNFDPDRVTRLIGPKTYAALKPYRFHEPPTVLVNGRLPTHRKSEADVRFHVSGKTFAYWKFRVPDAAADVHWRGDTVTITNLTASFYNGRLAWSGFFDFAVPRPGADFRFNGRITRADLPSLVASLTGKTNHLEGLLSGTFAVTSANSKQPDSWTGVGTFRLRDGFLWNIPIFGVFSPILQKVSPGLGNSKVTSGSATFKLQRGVIRTDDLELRSSAVRLQYSGRVDLDGNVKARLQAEILRDAWAVGRLVSLALWPVTKIFEFQITGTINEPVSEPVYIPKFVLWPFQPFRSLKHALERDHAPPDSSPDAPQRPPSANPPNP